MDAWDKLLEAQRAVSELRAEAAYVLGYLSQLGKDPVVLVGPESIRALAGRLEKVLETTPMVVL